LGHGDARQQSGNYVYRVPVLPPTEGDRVYGAPVAVIRTLSRPNGLAFSPDGAHVYVGDSGAGYGSEYNESAPHHIMVYAVASGKHAGSGDAIVEKPPLPSREASAAGVIGDARGEDSVVAPHLILDAVIAPHLILDAVIAPHLILDAVIAPHLILDAGRLFITLDPFKHRYPDGLKTDDRGNLFVATAEGVHIYSPEADLLAKILTPKPTSNIAFGGPDGNTLFITATDSVWAAELSSRGAGQIFATTAQRAKLKAEKEEHREAKGKLRRGSGHNEL
jgi:sugar lactone lactonase YvrE